MENQCFYISIQTISLRILGNIYSQAFYILQDETLA